MCHLTRDSISFIVKLGIIQKREKKVICRGIRTQWVTHLVEQWNYFNTGNSINNTFANEFYTVMSSTHLYSDDGSDLKASFACLMEGYLLNCLLFYLQHTKR